jgi:hypothetical protein
MTREQLQSLIRPKFGDDVEIVCENPAIIGDVSMVSLGVLGSILVFRDEAGKKWAVQVPMGLGAPVKEAA